MSTVRSGKKTVNVLISADLLQAARESGVKGAPQIWYTTKSTK